MSIYAQRAIVSDPRSLYAIWEWRAEGPVLSTAYFVNTDPPFIRGTGVRLRVWRFALQLGICKRTKPFGRPLQLITNKFGEWDEEDPVTEATVLDWRSRNGDSREPAPGVPS